MDVSSVAICYVKFGLNRTPLGWEDVLFVCFIINNVTMILETPKLLVDYILDLIDTDDYIIITDHINDFCYINANQPDKLIVFKGKRFNISLDYILSNLSNNGTHTVYSATDLTMINEFYNSIF